MLDISREEQVQLYDGIISRRVFRPGDNDTKYLELIVQPKLNDPKPISSKEIAEGVHSEITEARLLSVRTGMRSLRGKLSRYFHGGPGGGEKIILTIKTENKGYKAEFERRSTQAEVETLRIDSEIAGVPGQSNNKIEPTQRQRHPRDFFDEDVRYYHYHLTLNDKYEPLWICKFIKFQVHEDGHLFALTDILPERREYSEAERQRHHRYEVIPTFLEQHLVIHVKRCRDNLDMTVQLFPNPDAGKDTWYCATIHKTQMPSVFVSTVAIMSKKPLGGDKEGPVDENDAKNLLHEWEKHPDKGYPKIVQLGPWKPGGTPLAVSIYERPRRRRRKQAPRGVVAP